MPFYRPRRLILPLILLLMPLILLLFPCPAATPTAADIAAEAILTADAKTYYLPPQPLAETPLIRLLTANGTVQLDAESYLIGVIAAEMPSGFAAEALSAQAVAARSYLLAHSSLYGKPRHSNADVCADSSHCQAYLSDAELRQRWGSSFDARYAKLQQAVAETRGLVLTYGGQIAEAPFCSACGGSTEAASAVWGGALPYLSGGSCGYCSHAPRYRQTEVLSLQSAAQQLDCQTEDLLNMQLIAESDGGRVAQIRIGGSTYSGTQLRSKLNLPSAAFCWLTDGEELRIYCRGFGHGVGLCQYGADGMAAEGAHFTAILQHYYPGTQLQQLY